MATLVLLLLMTQSADDLYRRGLLLLRNNDALQALVLLEGAAKLRPKDALVWMAVADARLRLGRMDDALAAESEARRTGGSDATVRKVRSMFHARFAGAAAGAAKDPNVVRSHLKQAVDLDPQRESYAVMYVQHLLDSKVEKEAEAECRLALRRFPKNAELHRMLGVALYAQGRNAEALDAFLQAIDLAPSDETQYASLETLLPEAGTRLKAILSRLETLSKLAPKSPLAPYLTALCVPEQRHALLLRAVQLDPGFWPAYFELQKDEPDPHARIRLLNKALELHPNHAAGYYALAQAYASTGDRALARKAREQHHRLSKLDKGARTVSDKP